MTRATETAGTSAVAEPGAGADRGHAPEPHRFARGRNPWRRPWFLEGFTWLYIAWSLLPIALAVLFSFNDGKSQSVWQGFSMRWYTGDPLNSVLHDPTLHAAVLQTLRLSPY